MENTTSSHKPYISDLDASIQAMRDADKVQAAPAEPEPAAAEKQPVQGQESADVEDAELPIWSEEQLAAFKALNEKLAQASQFWTEGQKQRIKVAAIEAGIDVEKQTAIEAMGGGPVAFAEVLGPNFFKSVIACVNAAVAFQANGGSFLPLKQTGITREEFLEEIKNLGYGDKTFSEMYSAFNGEPVENPLEADTPIRRVIETIRGRKNSLQRRQQDFTAVKGIGERVYTFARKDLRQRLTSNYLFLMGPDGKEEPLPPDFPYSWFLLYTQSIMIKEKNYTGEILLHMPSALREAGFSLDFRKFDGQKRKEAFAAIVRDIQHAFIDVKTRIDGSEYQVLNFKNEKGGEWEYVTFSSPALQKLFEKYVTGRQEIFKKKQAPKKIKDGKAQGGKKKAGSPSKGDIPSIFCHILKTSQLSSKYPAALQMAVEILGTVWTRNKTPDADLRQNAHTDFTDKEGVSCHVSLSTLSERCPHFLARLKAQKRTNAVNTFLSRHFKALKSILIEALEGFYKDVTVDIPPVSSTTWRDKVIVIKHHGAKKNRPLSDT